MNARTFIGTSAWNVPAFLKDYFHSGGSHLERYSRMFSSVEICTSFYKDHKASSYAKWAQAVPNHFRFSVKLSRFFTQDSRLEESGLLLKENLAAIAHLKEKWGILLIQLPPTLEFNSTVTTKFLKNLRKYYDGKIVWEPRHESWAAKKSQYILKDYSISKVYADPEPCPLPDAERENLEDIKYFRLHGSPQIYKSRYSRKSIHSIQESILNNVRRETWCMFDNTAYGYATLNAMELKYLLDGKAEDSRISAQRY